MLIIELLIKKLIRCDFLKNDVSYMYKEVKIQVAKPNYI
jgi:hypothetical protein